MTTRDAKTISKTTPTLLAAALALAGCSTDRLSSAAEAPPTNGRVAATRPAPVPTPPPVDMAGRWLFASPGGGTCGMNFGATPGSPEGTIAPEGGCPGNFFTSRRWVFDQGALLIRNHKGEPLAQLAFLAPGRFEGQAATGEAVTLTR